jgi:hypothetical protein
MLLRLLVQPLINGCDLLHPAPPFGMVEAEDLVARPVKMIGHIGYLLKKLVEGVA